MKYVLNISIKITNVHGHLDVMKYLVEQGADIQYTIYKYF